MISNTKIDKIGEKIKTGESLNKLEREALLVWRNSFIPVLDYYHKRAVKKIGQENIVTIGKRLKRIPSINKKLKRSKTLRLSSMQDIAGLRLVFKNHSELLSAVNIIRSSQSKNNFKRMYDYNSQPKKDGYRSVHLIYQSLKYNRLIELQFRTEMEHIWATAVEVYGAIYHTSFKTGEGDNDWKEFFRLLSSFFAMIEKSPVLDQHKTISKASITRQLKKIMKKLKVIDRLAAATKGIETIVTRHSRGKMGKYALIELNISSGKTSVEVFSKGDIAKAIEVYTKRELDVLNEPNINIVFANIESLESLQEAYPNYFLDTDKLIQILGKISIGQPVNL